MMFYVVTRTAKRTNTSLLDWTLLGVSGFYGIGWAAVILSFGTIPGYYWEPWLSGTEQIWPLHTIFTLLLVLGIVLGWKLTIKRGPQKKKMISIPWHTFAWSLLFVAVISQTLYSIAHGGLLGLTESYAASAIRSGTSEISNPFSYLQPLGVLSAMSTIIFWGLMIGKKRHLNSLIGMSLAFSFSVFVYYTLLGRLDFLLFIISLMLTPAMAKGIGARVILLRGAIGMALIIILAFVLSAIFGIKASSSIS